MDYHSPATAMSRRNDDSASNLEKGTKPKWHFKTDTCVDWQHKVEVTAESHDIRHLLEFPAIAAPAQQRKYDIAKRIILLTLPSRDRALVGGLQTLHEIWGELLAKYMPSIDSDARKLWSKLWCMASGTQNED